MRKAFTTALITGGLLIFVCAAFFEFVGISAAETNPAFGQRYSHPVCQITLRAGTITKIEKKDYREYKVTADNNRIIIVKNRVDFVIGTNASYHLAAHEYPVLSEKVCDGDRAHAEHTITFSDFSNLKKTALVNVSLFLRIDAAHISAIRRLTGDRYVVDFYGTEMPAPHASLSNLPDKGRPKDVFTIEIDPKRFRFPNMNDETAGPIFNGFVQGHYPNHGDAVSISVFQVTISFPTQAAADEYFKIK